MNLSSAFICYAITVLVCIGVPCLVCAIASKRGYKLSILHNIVGYLFFGIFFVGYYLVLGYHLAASDGVAEYYNTATYRVVIIALLTIFSTVLLWLFGMIVYMRRQAYKACLSFFAGFGNGGCLAVGCYALLMLVMLTIQCLSSSFVAFDTEVCAFYFSDGTYFSVFQPMSGHVSFALVALSFLAIAISFALILCRITSAQVPFWTTALAFVGLILLLGIFLVVLCFMPMFGLPHYLMAVIEVVCALISACLVRLTYRFIKIPDQAYKKQFV